jgi:hypothetical protein
LASRAPSKEASSLIKEYQKMAIVSTTLQHSNEVADVPLQGYSRLL